MLSHTGRNWRWAPMDVLSGRTRSRAFLALNPNGKMPLLQWPDGRLLAESNAMLLALAEGSHWLPADPWSRALAYQWLFFEQYTHEPAIAVARFLLHYDHGQVVDAARIRDLHDKGAHALSVMEQRLSEAPFFAGEAISVADLALFAYTHVAEDGGFNLSDYPSIGDRLARVRAEPGHFDLCDSPA